MAVLYVDEYGASIRASHGLIVIEKDDVELSTVRVQELESIVIEENCSITSSAVGLLLRNGVNTAFISHGGDYLGRLEPQINSNINLRRKQYQLSGDEEFALAVSKSIASGKLANMRVILLRYSRSGDNKLADEGAGIITGMMDQIEAASIVSELLGIEGNASRAYFDAFPCIINEPFSFTDRNRRPPQDPVNAMLGFAYALLENQIECAISCAGLDPYCGFYHQDRYGRESLVLDLMEEMRPVIADSVVINCCNRMMLHPESDFENRDGGVFLNESGIQKFFRAFNTRMDENIKPSDEMHAIPYRRLCGLQSRIFAGCVMNNDAEYKPFIIK